MRLSSPTLWISFDDVRCLQNLLECSIGHANYPGAYMTERARSRRQILQDQKDFVKLILASSKGSEGQSTSRVPCHLRTCLCVTVSVSAWLPLGKEVKG
jgi:hypothetical protein